MSKGIVVLDFGGQYAHLIANRIRRLNVYAEIRSPAAPVDQLQGAAGLVLSGGPASVYDPHQPAYDPELFDLDLPILGLCYGHQLLCQRLGGRVEPGQTMEFGAATLQVERPQAILDGLEAEEPVWMSHRDSVVELPDGFITLGSTPDCPAAAIGHQSRPLYGLQFHPEVTHTRAGMQILDNFLTQCQAPRDWTMEHYIDETMTRIQQQTAGRKVFLLVSGGVDSTVSFLLLNRALGEDRVLGLHIDNGFMRANETALVERLMRESGFHNLHVVDASDDFLRAVEGLSEPEEKRHRIGAEFIHVRDRALADMQLDPEEWLLGQGTLYTDTIESGGTQNAALIKTHHNRVAVIEQLLAEGKVVEPLDQLYKDEVRLLGEKLGLPPHLVWRHPFPGPGLGVRVLCTDGQADSGDLTATSQAQALAAPYSLSAALLPLQSVGVQGDSRTYAHPAAVAGAATWDQLETLSTALTNELPQINRVIYQLAPAQRPPQQLKPSYLTRPRLDLLRRADALAMDALERGGFMQQVTQMPTVLVPLSSDGEQESIVLRPISTDDFMTASFTKLPRDFVDELATQLLALDGIEAVFYDVTNKPPGTVEWE
ncbi:MAG: glutamine-hydrolyzing GMP synthase [Candidatus Latescibacteria bacterium]|nr:glutamine-hydrolyzing GMP synthase [Candidatus Latescibacterota bacterium]